MEIQIVSSDINKINTETKKSEKIPGEIYKHLDNKQHISETMYVSKIKSQWK